MPGLNARCRYVMHMSTRLVLEISIVIIYVASRIRINFPHYSLRIGLSRGYSHPPQLLHRQVATCIKKVYECSIPKQPYSDKAFYIASSSEYLTIQLLKNLFVKRSTRNTNQPFRFPRGRPHRNSCRLSPLPPHVGAHRFYTLPHMLVRSPDLPIPT